MPRTVELPAGLPASCAAMPRLRSSRYLVGPRFHCLQDHRPKSTSEPFLQLVEHFRCFASPKVADPSAEILRDVMLDHLGEAYAVSAALAPDSLLAFRRSSLVIGRD